MKKLLNEVGERQFAKYYEDDKLAESRQGKHWDMTDISSLPAWISRGLNTGELKEPRYLVSWDDGEIKLYSEGAANNLMMELTHLYKDVKVYKL